MKIETYEIEELNSSEATQMACDSEAIELIEKLGLNGQKSLTDTATATRFPYPRLTKTQEIVFNALFPERSRAEDYREGIIPLRVLQVIAFCKDKPQTKQLEIWHVGSAKEDPILIGRTGEYNSEAYLLARWGDALPSFEELKIKALPLLKAQMLNSIESVMARLNGYSKSIESLAKVYLETGKRPTWNCYE